MSTQLLEIQPRELNFTFELKKQSSCAIHLVNVSDQYVAFKVKTTSPKKYCVRPNIGIVKPKSTCDFMVTMQAQRSAPSDMQCRDKFLVQSTIVPFGMTEDEITPGIFAKDSGKYVEESKLKVIISSPPHSPALLPLNGDFLKLVPSLESSAQKDKVISGIENLPPIDVIAKDVEDVENAKDMDELTLAKDVELRPANIVEDLELSAVKDVEVSPVEDVELSPVEDVELSPVKVVEPEPVQDVEGKKLKLSEDIEKLKSRLNILNTELSKAEFTIAKLNEEKSTMIQERETLRQKLAVMRKNSGGKEVQAGFPFLFVCMVGLISLALGYLLHP